jgi:antitoxin YefM
MNIKTTLSISEARRKIFDIAEDVQTPNTYYTLTENGRPKAVVISAEEFDSIMETVDVLKEFPDIRSEITQAEKEYKAGQYSTIEQILEKEGFRLIKNVSDGISSNRKSISRKTARGSTRKR